MRQFVINNNDGGQRLDKFVSKTVRGLPSSLLYKYLRLKKIKVNGKRAEGKTVLNAGDTVTMYIPEEFFGEAKKTEDLSAELGRVKPKLTVAYEDDNLLILDKAPGVLTHTGDETEKHTDDFSERSTLLFHATAYLYQKGAYDPAKENSFAPALCNRIDRNTGGLVIAAKNAEALRAMNELIRDGGIEKHYYCAVHGKMPREKETMEAFLRKNEKTKTVSVSANKLPGAKPIATAYRVLQYSSRYDLSLLDVHLITGRTHQIRAHLEYAGHPLLGEGKYGENREDRALGYTHQALYAFRMVIHCKDGFFSYLNGKEITADPESVRFLSFFGGKSRIV